MEGPTRCASSQLMTALLTWRNPHGSEEKWIEHNIGNIWKHRAKVLTTEAGLFVLTATSIVETIALSALSLLSLTCYLYSDKPYKFFAKLLESSSFTVLWSIFNALFFNIGSKNVFTKESFIRFFTPGFRLEDRLSLVDWHEKNGLEHVNCMPLGRIISEAKGTIENIDQGSALLKESILASATPEVKHLFKERDPSLCMFVLAKTVFVYALGEKQESGIPDFFKPKTQKSIQRIRTESGLFKATVRSKLQELFTNPTAFAGLVDDPLAKATFEHLKKIAKEELKNGLLVTKCWEKASEGLV